MGHASTSTHTPRGPDRTLRDATPAELKACLAAASECASYSHQFPRPPDDLDLADWLTSAFCPPDLDISACAFHADSFWAYSESARMFVRVPDALIAQALETLVSASKGAAWDRRTSKPLPCLTLDWPRLSGILSTARLILAFPWATEEWLLSPPWAAKEIAA